MSEERIKREMTRQTNRVLKARMRELKKPLRKKTYKEEKHRRDIRAMRKTGRDRMRIAQSEFMGDVFGNKPKFQQSKLGEKERERE